MDTKRICEGTTSKELPCKSKITSGRFCRHHGGKSKADSQKCKGFNNDDKPCGNFVSKDGNEYCHGHSEEKDNYPTCSHPTPKDKFCANRVKVSGDKCHHHRDGAPKKSRKTNKQLKTENEILLDLVTKLFEFRDKKSQKTSELKAENAILVDLVTKLKDLTNYELIF